jgi:hypothetical protein
MFTTGKTIFAILFFLAFVALMIYSYRKDLAINRIHFPKPYRIMLFIVLIISVLFLIVKFKQLIMK